MSSFAGSGSRYSVCLQCGRGHLENLIIMFVVYKEMPVSFGEGRKGELVAWAEER